MELKDGSSKLTITANMFQSHLYGIESALGLHRVLTGAWFQSHLYGIERLASIRTEGVVLGFNRTFMELKV